MYCICLKNGFVVYPGGEAWRVGTAEDAPASAFLEDAEEAVRLMHYLIASQQFTNAELCLKHVDELNLLG